ncbi:hypothetical protein BXZ70DRAFT_942796 [Cristinia sonorae]|uniref:Uncharacterized protein n=1 Tax=Cristinia sonorae TaxID=1940300 RepID=A0A8K0XNY3_9AGAR|nr:hypothetical protein BXZ70DRAFT_942796 [Cristinia sonorae]
MLPDWPSFSLILSYLVLLIPSNNPSPTSATHSSDHKRNGKAGRAWYVKTFDRFARAQVRMAVQYGLKRQLLNYTRFFLRSRIPVGEQNGGWSHGSQSVGSAPNNSTTVSNGTSKHRDGDDPLPHRNDSGGTANPPSAHSHESADRSPVISTPGNSRVSYTPAQISTVSSHAQNGFSQQPAPQTVDPARLCKCSRPTSRLAATDAVDFSAPHTPATESRSSNNTDCGLQVTKGYRMLVGFPGVTRWQKSSNSSRLDTPLSPVGTEVGEVYVHTDVRDGSKQLWVWKDETAGSRWEVARKGCPHPRLPERCLTFGRGGDPSWVLWQSMAAAKARERRREFMR